MKKEILDKENGLSYPTILLGIGIGLFTTLIFMLVFALVLYFLNLDRGFAAPFSTVSISIGGLASAFYTAKKMKKKGYVVGLAVGILVFAIITVVSIIVDKGGFSLNTLFHFVIVVLSSVVGGILGVNKAEKKYI